MGTRVLGRILPVILIAAAFAPTCVAHGGTYRGPTVPGSAGPVSPGTGPSRGGASTPSSTPYWRYWWGLNWDRVLDTRVRLALAAAARKGAPEWADFRPLSGADKKKLLLPTLFAGLADRDGEVRAAAAIALGKVALPQVVIPLVGALKDKERLVRNAASLALGLSGQPRAEGPMLKAFTSTRTPDDTRAWLAVGLGFLRTKPALDALMKQLQALKGRSIRGAKWEVLLCCAAGMAVSRNPSRVPEILDILAKAENRKTDVQGMLYAALGKIGDRRALPFTVAGLSSKHALVRTGAAVGTSLLAGPDDLKAVTGLLKLAMDEPLISIRALTLCGLGRVGGTRVVDYLRRFTKKQGGRIQVTTLWPFAATGLALCGVPSGDLDSPLPDHRGAYAVCHAIAGAREALPRLTKVLAKERNPGAFSEIALAVGMLQGEQGRTHLRRVFEKERRSEFRIAAAIALGFMGDDTVLTKVLDMLAQAPSASQQGPLLFAATLFGRRRCVEQVIALYEKRRTQDTVRALCCVALGNIGDSRRYPVLSELSGDFPWIIISPVLTEIINLY